MARDLDRDEQIRRKAYEIWESEGRPAWQSERHWDEATAIIEAENLTDKPLRAAEPDKDKIAHVAEDLPSDRQTMDPSRDPGPLRK